MIYQTRRKFWTESFNQKINLHFYNIFVNIRFILLTSLIRTLFHIIFLCCLYRRPSSAHPTPVDRSFLLHKTILKTTSLLSPPSETEGCRRQSRRSGLAVYWGERLDAAWLMEKSLQRKLFASRSFACLYESDVLGCGNFFLNSDYLPLLSYVLCKIHCIIEEPYVYQSNPT
jgi:hypothetical protein